MPLDPSIPLSVRPPQIESPSDVLVRGLQIQHLQQQQATDVQQRQLHDQQIQENTLKLAAEQRSQAAIEAQSAAVKGALEPDAQT
jgi:hypothetical protein